MKLSYSWLNDYIDLSSIDPSELGNILTMKTCEVEEVSQFLPHLANFPTSKVIKVEPHPNADKLKICKVQVSENEAEWLQIVTGAHNVYEGGIFPLAPIGSTLPNGTTIKQSKLRGQDSSGMLCSAKELGAEDYILETDDSTKEEGLWVLPKWPVGKSLAEMLMARDWVIEIDNKSITNRPDLWGHFGFARELSALLNLPLKRNPMQVEPTYSKPALPVSIKDRAARAYASALISGITIKPSSVRLQSRLIACGLSPINNVVDASNYVMLDLGQPNHAFDKEHLKEKIIIDFSRAGEKVITLDEKERTLPESIALIRDASGPVAVAGVMGCENTSVSQKTGSVFLESACFYRKDIRKAVSSLGLRTDASARFEKGQDTSMVVPAILRFFEVLQNENLQLNLSNLHLEMEDVVVSNEISVSGNFIREKMGMGKAQLSNETIGDILTRLGMGIELDADQFNISVPTWRSVFDLCLPEDIVEEIGRVVGYSQVTPAPLEIDCEVPRFTNTMRLLEHRMRDYWSLAARFQEVSNYSFITAQDVSADKRHAQKTIDLLNPINADLTSMRISLMPSLLKNIESNYRLFDEIRFFELGRIYIPQEKSMSNELPKEQEMFSGICTSQMSPEDCLENLKKYASGMLVSIGLPLRDQVLAKNSDCIFHPGRRIQIEDEKNNVLVKLGQLHPTLTEELGINVYFIESQMELLLQAALKSSNEYHPLLKYPATHFELTLLLEKTAWFLDIQKHILPEKPDIAGLAIEKTDKTFIEKLEYLGSFTGDQLPAEKKAVSIRITWRNAARTLQPNEITKLQENLIENLKTAGINLR